MPSGHWVSITQAADGLIVHWLELIQGGKSEAARVTESSCLLPPPQSSRMVDLAVAAVGCVLIAGAIALFR